jgi:hypothetical protein
MKNVFRQLTSLVLPVFVLIIIPFLIEPNIILTIHIISIIGLTIVLIGLIVMILTIKMFVQMGEGTLAHRGRLKNLL